MARNGIDLTLDEAYERMHRTGPEFDGWLSNHGPMAADALLRLGQGDRVDGWLQQYQGRLEDAPSARWRIGEPDWAEYLGDPTRLGDWTVFFGERLQEAAWQDVLTLWWPRLLPGSIAASTHGLIRTGHAVRALLEEQTEPRLRELSAALGYWAARWQPLPLGARAAQEHPGEASPDGAAPRDGSPPPSVRPRTSAEWAGMLSAAPRLELSGGARARLRQLDTSPEWAAFLKNTKPSPSLAAGVPGAIDGLVDAAVGAYADNARGNPVMLVHAATAPRAAGLCLLALPRSLWPVTLQWAWQTSAAITAMYPAPHATAGSLGQGGTDERDSHVDVSATAETVGRHGDEHVIKFTEVALHASRHDARDLAIATALEHIPPIG